MLAISTNNFNDIQDDNNKAMEDRFFETQNKYRIVEKKLLENIEDLLNTEKKLNDAYNRNDILSKENSLIKNQLSYFENAFNNMKKRKQEENEELKKELDEVNEEKNEINKEKDNLKMELNEIKSKYKFLQQENDIIKTEIENMKNIIRENEDKVKISDEKINSIDNIINTYKKTNDDLLFELEKLKQEKKLEKEQSNKIISEFEFTLKEKDSIYENELEKRRIQFEQNLNEQIEENENLNSKLLEYKMDRDKYKGDLEIANDEKERLKNENNEQKIKFNQILNNNDEYYQNQINILNQRLRAKMQENNNELNNSDNFNNITNQKLAKNGEEVFNELIKLKKENEQLKIENEQLKKENQRLKNNDNYDI